MTKARFRLTTADSQLAPVVTASGEIDLANIDEFGAVLARAADDSPSITVDLAAVTYCDSAALRELFSITAATEVTLLVPARGAITTLLKTSGLDQVATVRVIS